MTDPHIEQVTEPETATPLGVQGLLAAIQVLLRRSYRLMRVVVFVTFVLVVTVIGLELQVSSRNQDIRNVKSTAEDARQAARDAKKAVEDAIATSRSGTSIDPAKVADALGAINRIEVYLCGGPCPAK